MGVEGKSPRVKPGGKRKKGGLDVVRGRGALGKDQVGS